MKPPHNVAFLERAIRNLVDSNGNGIRLRTMMANVIVGQFLDGAVMRGGGALKFRYGGATTRYTMDFDAARSADGAHRRACVDVAPVPSRREGGLRVAS